MRNEPRLKTQLCCVVNGDQKALAMWGYEAHSVETLVAELRAGYKQIFDLCHGNDITLKPVDIDAIREIALKHAMP